MCHCKDKIIIKEWDNTQGKVTFCGKCGKDLDTSVQEELL